MTDHAGPSNPVAAFSAYSSAVKRELQNLVASFEERRVGRNDTVALTQAELDGLVDGILERLPAYENAQDVTRVTLEKALENTVINLPSLISGDWQDDEAHFLLYHDVLDILVACVNRQLVQSSLGMETLELLLEAQTVQNAERLFTYLETRMDRLTEGMMPGKGKALVILRTLNDLLRRLSKSTHTVFCGRILLFLASIFPLGERSGVNLRGEFNKENITYFEPEEPRPEEEMKADEDTHMEDEKDESDSKKDKNGKKSGDKPKIQVEAPEDGEEVESMDLDASLKAAAGSDGAQVSPTYQIDKKRASNEPEFYTLFWSLQRYFSNPQTLFTSTIPPNLPPILLTFATSFPTVPTLAKDGSVSGKSTAAATPNLTLLREGIQKMLFVFGEASKKEKALQGATKEKEGSGRGSREKKTSEAEVKKMFFYPKFLTSKALIDLEIADAKFRKQVLVQCLILFQYLNSFTEAAKVKQAAALGTNVNRSLLLPYKLSEADHKWIKELEARVYTEISRTPTDGESFVKTVRVLLQGERNWIRWKATSCQLFEKPPLPQEASTNAATQKKRLEAPIPGYPHKAGTAALSRLWKHEKTSIQDHVNQGKDSDLDRLLEQAKHLSGSMAFRKEELKEDGKSEADFASDTELAGLVERHASLAWRILRLVSSTHMHLFSKIGVMDMDKLIEEMSKPPPAALGTPAASGASIASTAPATLLAASESDRTKSEEPISRVATPVPAMSELAEGEHSAILDAPSPATNKRPRADSNMEVDHDEAKKQKTSQ